MLPMKTLALLVLAALFCARGWAALPAYEVVELGLPATAESEAVDVNDRGEVVGFVTEAGIRTGFLWKDGQVTFLNGEPRDINNRGVIVGSRRINNGNRAWLWEEGGERDLGQLFETGSVADAINELGDVVGTVEQPDWYHSHIYLFSEPPVRLTRSITIGYDGIDFGTSQNLSAFATKVNNNHFIAAIFLGDGVLHTSFESEAYPQRLASVSVPKALALGLNQSNHVAGSFRKRGEYRTRAGIFANGQWTMLLSPHLSEASAEAVNDNGASVGWVSFLPPLHSIDGDLGFIASYARLNYPTAAMLWQGLDGIDLNSVTALPGDAILRRAVAINNAGHIAATVTQGQRSRAVLLRRMRDGAIPRLEISGVSDSVLWTNRVEVRLETAYRFTETAEVTFRLHHQFGTRTNAPVALAGAGVFSDLGPGLYTIQAEVRDDGRMHLFSAPRNFAIGGVSEFQSPELTWSRHLQVGLRAGFGGAYVVQESNDLIEWRTLPSEPGTGGLLNLPVENGTRFFRTLRVREAVDLAPATFSIARAPTSVAAHGIFINTSLTGPVTIYPAADGTFRASGAAVGTFEGNYTYTSSGMHARLSLQGPTAWRSYYLEFEFRGDRDAQAGVSGAVRGWPGIAIPFREFTGAFSIWNFNEPPVDPGNGGGNGNVGTVPAPLTISRIDFANHTSGTGPSSYSVTFSGGASGTFMIIAGSVGQGTYTYLPTGMTARLVMTYTDFPGDSEDLTLYFQGASGSLISSAHAGTQVISGTTYPISGTFTYVGQ